MSFIGSWIGGAYGYMCGFIYSEPINPIIQRITLTPHSLAPLPPNCIISDDIELIVDLDNEENGKNY